MVYFCRLRVQAPRRKRPDGPFVEPITVAEVPCVRTAPHSPSRAGLHGPRLASFYKAHRFWNPIGGEYAAGYAGPGRTRAGWAYSVPLREAAKLTMPVLSIGGEKANRDALGKQAKLVGCKCRVDHIAEDRAWADGRTAAGNHGSSPAVSRVAARFKRVGTAANDPRRCRCGTVGQPGLQLVDFTACHFVGGVIRLSHSWRLFAYGLAQIENAGIHLNLRGVF